VCVCVCVCKCVHIYIYIYIYIYTRAYNAYIYRLNDRKIPTVTLATYRNMRTLPGTILPMERERMDR